ncbi:MAG TPA: DUF1566 domain-containing protein [bacterium]|nr:DUF1566 domain-containing protein [bacterium]
MKPWLALFFVVITVAVFFMISCGDDDDDDDDNSMTKDFCQDYVATSEQCAWWDDSNSNVLDEDEWIDNCVSRLGVHENTYIRCLQNAIEDATCDMLEYLSDDCWDGWVSSVYDTQVWTDKSTGLMWQTASLTELEWEEAVTFCADLDFEGHDDWRLPTIDELRTLIRGCHYTEPDGDCAASEQCNNIDACHNEACEGCISGEGPNYGFYMPYEFNPYCAGSDAYICSIFWSSTPVSGSNGEQHWGAWYTYADVAWDNSDSENAVHCVREAS